MVSRKEVLPTKQYAPGPTKTRVENVNWHNMPGWALLTINEACALSGLSKTALQDRVAAGEFPAPGKDGKRRVWRLSDIRAYCETVAANVGGRHE